MTFRELGLCAPILKALEEQGYQVPSPIQQYAIPPALKGRDVLGCAQTGTGKTCAFATPILQRLNRKKAEGHRIRALILTPTRELAIQIGESFQAYGTYMKLRSAVIFGGVGQGPQVEQIKRGVDILVATPGRLGDLYQQKWIDLSHLEIFVLDEADRMLDMGFIHDVRKILNWLPEKKQTLFFSATMPDEIIDLVNTLLHDPIRVEVDPISSPVEAIEQSIYFVDKANKTRLLAHLVDAWKVKSALVFTRTKHGANKVARDLEKAGISAAAIHGNKSQTARQQALADFKTGKIRCLVATDIAARGLDIDELSYVFNYNLTEVPETYVHRIGRTGRAGREGSAISLCDFTEKDLLKGIEKLIGRKLPVVEEHPYPMQVLEAPKRDKNGKIIHAEDAEAREAAKERKKTRQVQTQATPNKTETVKTAVPVSEQKEPKNPSKRGKKKNTKPEKDEAKALKETESVSEYAPFVKTERPRLMRYGSLMDTGDAMPNTDFYRPNPLDSDVIMDATARLLAPRRSSVVPQAEGIPSSPKEQKKNAGKRDERPKKRPAETKQAVNEKNTERKHKNSPKTDSLERGKKERVTQPKKQELSQPLNWEEKPKKQLPRSEKSAPHVAPEKKGKQRHRTENRTKERSTSKSQIKDSTQQASLMKPFYLDFGR